MIDVDAMRARTAKAGLTVEIAGAEFLTQPLSARAVAQFEARRRHSVALVRYFAMRRFLRAAFGWHWSYLTSDPVSLLMARSAEVRGKVIAALLHQATAGLPVMENVL